MDSFKEARQQIRLSFAVIGITITIGVVGFMILEQLSLLDSIWLTVITLATIGYGDIYARTAEGRVFTVLLILFGLGAVGYGLQASAAFFLSPIVNDFRQRRRIQRAVNRLQHHYIICGAGELVDDTIQYLLESNARRMAMQKQSWLEPLDNRLQSLFGTHTSILKRFITVIMAYPISWLHRGETLLDQVVVVTPDHQFADHLRSHDVLVIEGDPTNDQVLRLAGVDHAQAIIIMLDDDTEALLSVLTVRSVNETIDIIAAAMEEQAAHKMIRVGANDVVAHYDIVGSFLNNATLRPVVYDFLSSILFSDHTSHVTTQIRLTSDSPWIGKKLGDLQLRDRYASHIIGLRQEGGLYRYTPPDDYPLQEGEFMIAVTPVKKAHHLQSQTMTSVLSSRIPNWQRLPRPARPSQPIQRVYTLDECPVVIGQMRGHFIICGLGRVSQNAIHKLDPARPFVIICADMQSAADLLARGFRVVLGKSTDDAVLRQAGVERALGIMIDIEDDATSVMTVLNCRAINKRLLITAAAANEQIQPKLLRAGADRVMVPFQVAAQFILLSAIRPVISEFLQYIVYNYHAGIETTELYMQADSPWIGQSLRELQLEQRFEAGVLGIRLVDGQYEYAPPTDHVVQTGEVLIIVVPMRYADELRVLALGSAQSRPSSLRRSIN